MILVKAERILLRGRSHLAFAQRHVSSHIMKMCSLSAGAAGYPSVSISFGRLIICIVVRKRCAAREVVSGCFLTHMHHSVLSEKDLR